MRPALAAGGAQSVSWLFPSAATMPLGTTVLHTLGWQLVGLGCLVLHVLLVRELGPAAAAVVLGGATLLYATFPLAGLVVYWQLALYQNAVVAFLCEGMEQSRFQVTLGTGFMATGLLGTVAAVRIFSRLAEAGPRAVRIALLVCAAGGVAMIYAVYGAAESSPTSAAVYFRAATGMLLMLLIGLDVGRIWDFRAVALGYIITLLVGLGYTYLEISDPAWWYELTGNIQFMNLKYSAAEADWPFLSPGDLIATRTSVPFNVTGSEATGSSFRFGGPNLHSISYAYVIALAGIAAGAMGWCWVLVPVAAILVAIGVKGAILSFLSTTAFWALWRWTGRARLVLLGIAIFVPLYTTVVILFGLRTGDFHVIGLIGGVNGFLRNPLGHGIGAGGNLSDASRAGLDLIELQQHGAEFALESAVGVLLYQLGIGVVAHLAVFSAVLGAVRPVAGWAFARPRSGDVAFIGTAMIVINGLFQEEAYTTYALGGAMLFAGTIIANRRWEV